MKIFPVVLAVSLAANAVLAGMMLVGPTDDTSSTAAVRASTTTAGEKSAARDAVPGPEVWAGLSADDLTAQRDRLRAGGFPPEIIRAILLAQVSESFTARRKAIENAQGDLPYWKDPVRDPKMQQALRSLYREQEKAMTDLLGRDGRNDDPAYAAYLHRQFGDLPAGKVDQLRQIFEDYNQRRSDIYMSVSGGAILPEERQKLAELDKALHADFAAVLTPDELAEYDLRSSNTAQNLRFSLVAFDASEQEYRAIFQLQQAFDEKFGRMYAQPSQDEMRARREAQGQLTADIKAALGPERTADYERATDYNYRQTSQLVTRLGLPPETAAQVYAVQKEIQQRVSSVYQGNPTPAQRNEALATLAEEAKTRIGTVLGPKGFDAYRQNGGSWMQQLQPRPATPGGAGAGGGVIYRFTPASGGN